MRAFIATMLLFAAPALAWDGDDLWERDASGATPGGGGIWGTGGKSDHGVSCASCHVDTRGSGALNLTFAFSPALGSVGSAQAYKPGQTYQVTATMTGESLGRGFTTCGQFMTHFNNFAASFETSSGARAGQYVTDSGLGSASCQATITAPVATGTTLTYGRCHAVAGQSDEDRSSWSFSWTAPASGTGNVDLYWGVVDGDCDMMSMKDAVKTGKQTLVEGTAQRPRALPASFGVGLFALAVVWIRLKARRRFFS